ncbi:MAG TPA: LPS assembly protein LptD [Stellaceae bacterium]|nr:LPS assembly protein LptD [Stellaceae bacterium]
MTARRRQQRWRAASGKGRRRRLVRAGAVLLAAALGLPPVLGPARAQFSSLIDSDQKRDKNAPIVFQADEVQYDDKQALVVAKGHVEISQNGQILLADVVTYNQRTDTVTASGNVSLLQPTGDIIFADFIELRDSMNNAFATNVRILLSDRSRLAANAARRINGNRLELTRAVYSACDLCKSDPSAPPAWQLKAREMSDDKDLKLMEFRDATMEIDGWPIFYLPYMSHPDPSVKRASGFLPPTIGSSSTNGEHISIPYFLVLGPDKDLTLAPRFTTSAGELLVGEYRQRFGNGELHGIGSINYSNVGSGSNSDTGDRWRGHVDAAGVWDLDQTYRTGFQLQRVSDQTYLQRFGFAQPLFNAMTTRAYLEGFDPRGATDVNAYLFQPIVPGLKSKFQPIVLPEINRTWESEPDGFGGRWTLNGNLLDIAREEGTQTRRVSLGTAWNKVFRDGIGGEYKLYASVRGDTYSVNNLNQISNPDLPSAYFSVNGLSAAEPISHNFVTERAFPQIGLQWSYPLIRRDEEFSELIEPIVATFDGPAGGNQRRIPNEDSLGYQFRDTDLFRPDRLPGYDVLDTGQRVDYGLKGGLYAKDGGSYSFLIGQSARAQSNAFMPAGSGAEHQISDVVGRVTLSPSSYLDLIYRFRLDKATLSNRTQEIGFTVGPSNLRLSGTYLLIPAEQPSQVITVPGSGTTILYGKREQLTISGTAMLTRYWSLIASETINLTNSQDIVNGIATPQASSTSLTANLSAIYQDECMAFIASVTQSGIRNGDVTPGYSVLFSVVFKNLGEFGGNLFTVAGTNG